jgi:hypothetical protein
MTGRGIMHHICIFRANNSTSDHADAIATQCADLNIDYCFINFSGRFQRTWVYGVVLKMHCIKVRSSFLWLNTPYKEHQPRWLTKLNFKLAYSGYGLPMSNWTKGHFQAEMISSCKLLLASSEYLFSGYKRIQNESQLVLFTGDPLMWNLRKYLKFNSKRIFPMKKLLWAPHWSSNWFDGSQGFSRWMEKVGVIHDFAKMHRDLQIVVRPHPLLLNALLDGKEKANRIYQREIDGIFDPIKVIDSINEFNSLISLDNVLLSTSTLAEDVTSCDALITTGVSIIGYWAATGKPIAIYRDTGSPNFNESVEELIKLCSIVSTPAEVYNWLSSLLLLDNLKISDELVDESLRLFPTFDKSPIEIVVKNLLPEK